MPLRDRVFTKDEIAKLEKKTWIEIKDLIFETDKNILDYLGFHCTQWRKSMAHRLGDEEGSYMLKSAKFKGQRTNSQAANSSFNSAASPPKRPAASNHRTI